MILLEARFRTMSQNIDTIPAALLSALKLEFATVPVYLYALYSIDPAVAANQTIRDLLQSVAIEEMLHMAQVANILIALGHPPTLNDLVPTYPNSLPGGVEKQLTVELKPFSMELLQTMFLVIEDPKTPIPFPGSPPTIAGVVDPNLITIGEFYQNINTTIQQADDTIFTGDPAHQLMATYHGAAGADPIHATIIVQVKDKNDVAKAINLIIEQGEGKTVSPASPQDLQGDLAHYYRFLEILQGHKLVPNPQAAPTDPPEQQFFFDPNQPIAFDPAGVRPLRANPKSVDYPVGSPARTTSEAFNTTFTSLVQNLNIAFNGQPTALGATLGAMRALKNQALGLAAIDLGDGTHAGPTFEIIVPPAPPAPVAGAVAVALTSYAQVQAYLTKILTDNNELDDTRNNAPHGDWWNTVSYEAFVNGNVPGVKDPTTDQPVPTLVSGDSKHSNLILSLTGEGPLFEDANFGRMPADGPPFFTPEQIQPLSDWIDAGCPQGPIA